MFANEFLDRLEAVEARVAKLDLVTQRTMRKSGDLAMLRQERERVTYILSDRLTRAGMLRQREQQQRYAAESMVQGGGAQSLEAAYRTIHAAHPAVDFLNDDEPIPALTDAVEALERMEKTAMVRVDGVRV